MDPITAIGAAASVVGIVGFAIQLSQVLYEFIDSTKGAKEGIYILVSSIDGTSRAMNYVHGLLAEEKENIARAKKPVLFSKQALKDLHDNAVRCLVLFWRIESTILHSSPKPKNFEAELNARLLTFNEYIKANNVPPSALLTAKLKWTMLDSVLWFYISPKLEQYCVQLDRLKIDLIVMFQVISLHQKTQKPSLSPEDLRVITALYRAIQKMAGKERYMAADRERRNQRSYPQRQINTRDLDFIEDSESPNITDRVPAFLRSERDGFISPSGQISPRYLDGNRRVHLNLRSHSMSPDHTTIRKEQGTIQNGISSRKLRKLRTSLDHDQANNIAATAPVDLKDPVHNTRHTRFSEEVGIVQSTNTHEPEDFDSPHPENDVVEEHDAMIAYRRDSFSESNSDAYCTANEYESEIDLANPEQSSKAIPRGQPKLRPRTDNIQTPRTVRTERIPAEWQEFASWSQRHGVPNTKEAPPLKRKANQEQVSTSLISQAFSPSAHHISNTVENLDSNDNTSDIYNASEEEKTAVKPQAVEPVHIRREEQVTDNVVAATNPGANHIVTTAEAENNPTGGSTEEHGPKTNAAIASNSPQNASAQNKERRSRMQIINRFFGSSEENHPKRELEGVELNLDNLVSDATGNSHTNIVFPQANRTHAMDLLREMIKRDDRTSDSGSSEATNAVFTGFVIRGSKWHQIPSSDNIAVHKVTKISYRRWLKICSTLATNELIILEELLMGQNHSETLYRHSLYSLKRLKPPGLRIPKTENQALLAIIKSQLKSPIDADSSDHPMNQQKNEQEAGGNGARFRASGSSLLPPPFPSYSSSGPNRPRRDTGSLSAPPPYNQNGQPGETNNMTEDEYRDALTTYRVISMRFESDRGKWDHNAWLGHTTIVEPFSRSDIIARIETLQDQGPSVIEKKYSLTPLQQQLISQAATVFDQELNDPINFQWDLVQLESNNAQRKKGRPLICTMYWVKSPKPGTNLASLYERRRRLSSDYSGTISSRTSSPPPSPPPPPQPRPRLPGPPPAPPGRFPPPPKPDKQQPVPDEKPLSAFSSKMPQSPRLNVSKSETQDARKKEKAGLKNFADDVEGDISRKLDNVMDKIGMLEKRFELVDASRGRSRSIQRPRDVVIVERNNYANSSDDESIASSKKAARGIRSPRPSDRASERETWNKDKQSKAFVPVYERVRERERSPPIVEEREIIPEFERPRLIDNLSRGREREIDFYSRSYEPVRQRERERYRDAPYSRETELPPPPGLIGGLIGEGPRPPSTGYEYVRSKGRRRHPRDLSSDDSASESVDEDSKDIVHKLLMEWTPAGEEERETTKEADNSVGNAPDGGGSLVAGPAELSTGHPAGAEESQSSQDTVIPPRMVSPPSTLLERILSDRSRRPSRRATVEDADDESSSSSEHDLVDD